MRKLREKKKKSYRRALLGLMFVGSASLLGSNASEVWAQQSDLDELGRGRRGRGHMKGQRLLNKSRDVARLLNRRAHQLLPREKRQILRLLNQIQGIVNGTVVAPTPVPVPIPRPPINYACANAPFELSSEVFKKMKAFAYSSSGLNYSSSSSGSWAQQWLDQYSCDLADTYIQEFKAIKSVAYASSGFNMSSSGSVRYALDAVESRSCFSNVDYRAEASKFYRFAYSSSGLNLSSSGASQYAKEQLEQRYFVCQGASVQRVR